MHEGSGQRKTKTSLLVKLFCALSLVFQEESGTLGRIEQIHSGPDAHVRVAHVKIGGNVYVRPITKLCPLEFDSDAKN